MDNFTTMTIGERIKYLRKNKFNLTLEQFSEKIGVTKSAITHLEKDRNSLSDQMCRSICREYNVNYSWLMYGVGEIFTDSDTEIKETFVIHYSNEYKLYRKLFEQMTMLNKEQLEIIGRLMKIFLATENPEKQKEEDD